MIVEFRQSGCLKGRIPIQQLSPLGERELMSCEVDELGTIMLLQLPDMLGNSGLSDMEGLGCQGIAAKFHYGEEGLKFLVQHMLTSIRKIYYI